MYVGPPPSAGTDGLHPSGHGDTRRLLSSHLRGLPSRGLSGAPWCPDGRREGGERTA